MEQFCICSINKETVSRDFMITSEVTVIILLLFFSVAIQVLITQMKNFVHNNQNHCHPVAYCISFQTLIRIMNEASSFSLFTSGESSRSETKCYLGMHDRTVPHFLNDAVKFQVPKRERAFYSLPKL